MSGKKSEDRRRGASVPDTKGVKDQEEAFFNPFESLGHDLRQKDNAAGKTPEKPDAPLSSKAQPSSTTRVAMRGPTGSDDDESALLLRTMSGAGFRPIKSGTPGKSGSFAGKERTENATPESSAPRQARATSSAAAPPSVARDAAPVPPVPPVPEEDVNLFAKAMQGVNPVDGKGRDLPLKVKPESKAIAHNRDHLAEFLKGKVEFALEYTEEFFEGHVMGVDPLILAKLRVGQYSPESHIDLHGQTSEQAYEALADYIRQAYNKGQRSLVVVTGRGKNSPGGLSVLRQNMQNWLTSDPLKRVVLAFCTAQPKDGGAGAVYVLLRKYKKSTGKIRWDRGVFGSGWGGPNLL